MMAVHEITNLYWAAYSELSAIRHGRSMSDTFEVDQLLGRLEKAAKAQDSVADDRPAGEQPSTDAYGEILAGTLAVHRLDCTLADFARGLKYYADQEARKINCDTGLIRLLQRAACVGWENIQMFTRPITPAAPPNDFAEQLAEKIVYGHEFMNVPNVKAIILESLSGVAAPEDGFDAGVMACVREVRGLQKKWDREADKLEADYPDADETFDARLQSAVAQDVADKLQSLTLSATTPIPAKQEVDSQRLLQAIGWIVDAADAAYNEDSENVRIHEIFNIAAQVAGIKRRLPDENSPFEL